MSINSVEKIREKWARGELVVGTTVSFADPQVTELTAETGIDMINIDLEHGLLNVHQSLLHVMVARGQDVPIVIRVPTFDPVVIKPVLELHPAGIIVPRVTCAEEAALAIGGCKYPPRGTRGFGPARGTGYGRIGQMDFLEIADSETMVWIQIEDIRAVNNIDAILDLPGIDSIMLGPNDLSGTMGMLGQTNHPEVWAAIDTVVAKCKARNIPVGAGLGLDPPRLRRFIDIGLSWVTVNDDTGTLYSATKSMLDQVLDLEKEVKS